MCPDKASVAVIIVNYNSGPHLRRCLQSLARQTQRPDRVIVVDNARGDNSLEGCESAYPGVDIRHIDRNTGFAEGNNIGVKAASDCKWIALLNPDAFAHPDWLEQLMKGAQSHPEFDFFACRLVWERNRALLDGAGDAYRRDGVAWPRYQMHPLGEDGDEPCEVFGACGAGMLVKRIAFEQAGGFDESYFCYCEDVDLSFRLRLLGYRCLYLPHAVANHMGSATSGVGSDFSVYHSQRNLVWTFFKNMPSLSLWLYLPAHILENASSIAVFALKGRTRVIMRAKLAALLGLPRIFRARRHVQRARRIPARQVLEQMERGNVAASLWRRFSRRSSKDWAEQSKNS